MPPVFLTLLYELPQSTEQPNDVDTVTKLVLQMRKLKHSIGHSHTAI